MNEKNVIYLKLLTIMMEYEARRVNSIIVATALNQLNKKNTKKTNNYYGHVLSENKKKERKGTLRVSNLRARHYTCILH